MKSGDKRLSGIDINVFLVKGENALFSFFCKLLVTLEFCFKQMDTWSRKVVLPLKSAVLPVCWGMVVRLLMYLCPNMVW